jgi:spore germination cell wall hydrolase CwlJ-like protein
MYKMPTPEELLPDPQKSFGDHSELQLLAMALFGEARGVPKQTRQGIGHVIINRALNPGWWGHSLKEVILKPWQFSCFNQNDPNRQKLRDPLRYEPSEVWRNCCEDAMEVFERLNQPNLPDPVMGANHYYDTSIPPPNWADEDNFVLALPSGRHGHEVRFYKL